jgi:hypothetical protein
MNTEDLREQRIRVQDIADRAHSRTALLSKATTATLAAPIVFLLIVIGYLLTH